MTLSDLDHIYAEDDGRLVSLCGDSALTQTIIDFRGPGEHLMLGPTGKYEFDAKCDRCRVSALGRYQDVLDRVSRESREAAVAEGRHRPQKDGGQ